MDSDNSLPRLLYSLYAMQLQLSGVFGIVMSVTTMDCAHRHVAVSRCTFVTSWGELGRSRYRLGLKVHVYANYQRSVRYLKTSQSRLGS